MTAPRLLALAIALAVSNLARAGGAAAVPIPAPPGRLAGRVVNGAGEPIAAFMVNGKRFADAGGWYEILAPIDDFRLVIRATGFAPATVDVHATAAGTSGRRFILPDITVGAGEERIGEVLDARTERPVVAARVALAGPPESARVSIMRPERLSDLASTGYGGIYLVKKAARGTALLVVSHPDYLPEVLLVPARGGLPTVLLHRGGAISGEVRDASGRPLGGVRVTALCEPARDGQEALTGDDGSFRMDRLRPGRYTVVARIGGARPAVLEAVQVRDGQQARADLVARSSGPSMTAR